MIGRRKLNVFLSYSRADSPRVSELHHQLERASFDAWMDRSDIIGGDWRTAIKRGLRRSNFFLACLSTRTGNPGEVLEFEWDSALQVQKEQLEGEVYLIPVLLEPCDVPEKFLHLQWINLFEPEGWSRLLKVLRSKQAGPDFLKAATVAALVLLLGLAGAWLLTRDSRVPGIQTFRQEGGAAVRTRGDFAIGITLWKLRAPLASDPARARYLVHPPAGNSGGETAYTPIRLALSSLRPKDRVFFTVESSRNAYLYVADRELRNDGSKGRPMLIFPTGRVNGGQDQLSAGHLLEVPDRFSNPNYFEAQAGSSYGGEQLTFFLTPNPVAGIRPAAEAVEIPEALVQAWERQWGESVKQAVRADNGAVSSSGEADAMNQGSALSAGDPEPQMTYSARRKPADSLAVIMTLRAAQ